MINKYYDHILESYLRTSDRLKELLVNMEDPISVKLVSLIDADIKTNYNALDYLTSDEGKGKLSFLQDSQFTNKMKTISDYKELISDKNNSATVGKIVKGILKDNGVSTTDKEIDSFVNKFKASVNKEDQIKVVKGEEIRYWYLETNYYGNDRGTLWSSCMRHHRCQGYLDIYVENENVSLVIALKDGELVARALLWKGVNGNPEQYYLDRVYYYSDDYNYLMRDWVVKNVSENTILYGTSIPKGLRIKLEKYEFNEYPYMDTFSNSDDEGNFSSVGDGEYEYNDTYGGRSSTEDEDGIYSELHGYNISEEDAIWSGHYQDYLDVSRDDVVWSSPREQYYMVDDCVRTNDNDWILSEDAIEVISGHRLTVYIDPENDEYYEYDGEYYLWEYGVDTITDTRVPPNMVIELVNVDGLEEEPEKVRNFIELLYKSTDFVDPKISDIFSLGVIYRGEKNYISIEELAYNTMSTKNLIECHLLLEELKEDKVVDSEGYEYIMDQMEKALGDAIIWSNHQRDPADDDREVLTKFTQEDVAKVWGSVLKNSWDRIYKIYNEDRILGLLFPRSDKEVMRPYYKDIMENPFKYTKYEVLNRLSKKTGVSIDRQDLLRRLSITLRMIDNIVVSVYKESIKGDKGMFPMKKEEVFNNLFKLKLLLYYFNKL